LSKFFVFLFLTIMSTICSSQINNNAAIDSFWNYMAENEHAIAEMEVTAKVDLIYDLMSAVTDKLHIQCSTEKDKNGKYDLVFTSNGSLDSAPLVKAFEDRQIALTYFDPTYFRQPEKDYPGMDHPVLNLKIDSMYFSIFSLEERLAIDFYIYTPTQYIPSNEIFFYCGMNLDAYLGEEFLMNNVYAYDFYLLDETVDLGELQPLNQLRETIIQWHEDNPK